VSLNCPDKERLATIAIDRDLKPLSCVHQQSTDQQVVRDAISMLAGAHQARGLLNGLELIPTALVCDQALAFAIVSTVMPQHLGQRLPELHARDLIPV
jgi:hypothetical protein